VKLSETTFVEGMTNRERSGRSDRVAYSVSAALAIVAALVSGTSFFFWSVFKREAPGTIGNIRGAALAMLLIGVPLLIGSMLLSSRGSLRARFVWLGSLAYVTYTAVLFCFSLQFNSFFLLFAALLAVSFWALVTLLSHFDYAAVTAGGARVPVRVVAVYMLACVVVFSLPWLRDIIPATLRNVLPSSFEGTGINQISIYVLDFAFTFPLLALGAVWLWRRRAWGYVIAGMTVVMLTIETASIAISQAFGHFHDPEASLGLVPIMVAFTLAGLVFSALFLRGWAPKRG